MGSHPAVFLHSKVHELKIVEPILNLNAYNKLENLKEQKKEQKKKKILACSSAYGLWDMQEIISTSKECNGFFHYEPYLIWDVSLPWTISNHPFMWIKHVKKLPCISKLGFGPKWKTSTFFYVVNGLTFSQAQWEKNRNKQIQHENNVWVFFQE